VSDCTDSWIEPKPAWRPRKEACLAILPKKSPTSLLVSLADKVDNAEAILQDYRNVGEELWDRLRVAASGQFGTTGSSGPCLTKYCPAVSHASYLKLYPPFQTDVLKLPSAVVGATVDRRELNSLEQTPLSVLFWSQFVGNTRQRH
jgi:hypothetical protein